MDNMSLAGSQSACLVACQQAVQLRKEWPQGTSCGMHIVLHSHCHRRRSWAQAKRVNYIASWDECVDFDPVVRCASGSWYARPISLRAPILPCTSTTQYLYDDHRHSFRRRCQIALGLGLLQRNDGKFSREFAAPLRRRCRHLAACNDHHQGSRNIVSCQYFDFVSLGFVDRAATLISMHADSWKGERTLCRDGCRWRCYIFAASLSSKK